MRTKEGGGGHKEDGRMAKQMMLSVITSNLKRHLESRRDLIRDNDTWLAPERRQ